MGVAMMAKPLCKSRKKRKNQRNVQTCPEGRWGREESTASWATCLNRPKDDILVPVGGDVGQRVARFRATRFLQKDQTWGSKRRHDS